MLPLLWWKLSNLINLPLGSWLIIEGNDAILGAECLSLLLVDWAFSGGCSQVSLFEQKSILLSPYIASIPVSMATLFMNTLDNDRGKLGKAGIHKTGHPIHLVIKTLLYWGHPLVKTDISHKYLHVFFPFREVYLHISSLHFFITNFLIMFFASSWLTANSGHSPWISI